MPRQFMREGREARKLHGRRARNTGLCPRLSAADDHRSRAGGTEANNMALRGVQAERILVSAVEHPSVLAAAKASGKTVELIPVDA